MDSARTKDGRKASVVIHHVRYLLNLEEVKAVLEGKQNYTLILEFQGGVIAEREYSENLEVG